MWTTVLDYMSVPEFPCRESGEKDTDYLSKAVIRFVIKKCRNNRNIINDSGNRVLGRKCRDDPDWPFYYFINSFYLCDLFWEPKQSEKGVCSNQRQRLVWISFLGKPMQEGAGKLQTPGKGPSGINLQANYRCMKAPVSVYSFSCRVGQQSFNTENPFSQSDCRLDPPGLMCPKHQDKLWESLAMALLRCSEPLNGDLEIQLLLYPE